MRSYNLNIAGYNISLESSEGCPDLVPGERFLRFLTDDRTADVFIKVSQGRINLPEGTETVFNAPYIEEVNGLRIKKSDEFWSVHRQRDDLYLKTTFPLSSSTRSAVLKFSLKSVDWELWLDGEAEAADPLEYPLDGLILYYLTVIHGDIMIHASGISNSGRGYLFSGISGKGKSTMAALWGSSGADVIHDDRLIIRNTVSGYRMYNTPVYATEEPAESILHQIFLIEHGQKNQIIPLRGVESVSRVIANCIQHNWNPEIIARLLGSVSMMCTAVPSARLLFRPDKSVIDHILENDQEKDNEPEN